MQVLINVDQFKAQIQQFSANVRENVRRNVIEIGTGIYRELQANTPFLTGVARANWQVTIGPNDGGTWLFSSPRVRPPAVVSAADQSSVIQGYEPGQILTIYNNAPYIGRLDDGSSSQAPAGFIQASVAAAVGSFNLIGLI